MLLRALPLAALALAAGLCGGEDPVAVLEGKKQELLASTVEKKEFWAEVERKGASAKRLKELQAERLVLQQQLGELDARRAGLEPSLEPAREVNRRAEEVKAEILRREQELGAASSELERTLGRLEAGRRAGGCGMRRLPTLSRRPSRSAPPRAPIRARPSWPRSSSRSRRAASPAAPSSACRPRSRPATRRSAALEAELEALRPQLGEEQAALGAVEAALQREVERNRALNQEIREGQERLKQAAERLAALEQEVAIARARARTFKDQAAALAKELRPEDPEWARRLHIQSLREFLGEVGSAWPGDPVLAEAAQRELPADEAAATKLGSELAARIRDRVAEVYGLADAPEAAEPAPVASAPPDAS